MPTLAKARQRGSGSTTGPAGSLVTGVSDALIAYLQYLESRKDKETDRKISKAQLKILENAIEREAKERERAENQDKRAEDQNKRQGNQEQVADRAQGKNDIILSLDEGATQLAQVLDGSFDPANLDRIAPFALDAQRRPRPKSRLPGDPEFEVDEANTIRAYLNTDFFPKLSALELELRNQQNDQIESGQSVTATDDQIANRIFTELRKMRNRLGTNPGRAVEIEKAQFFYARNNPNGVISDDLTKEVERDEKSLAVIHEFLREFEIENAIDIHGLDEGLQKAFPDAGITPEILAKIDTDTEGTFLERLISDELTEEEISRGLEIIDGASESEFENRTRTREKTGEQTTRTVELTEEEKLFRLLQGEQPSNIGADGFPKDFVPTGPPAPVQPSFGETIGGDLQALNNQITGGGQPTDLSGLSAQLDQRLGEPRNASGVAQTRSSNGLQSTLTVEQQGLSQSGGAQDSNYQSGFNDAFELLQVFRGGGPAAAAEQTLPDRGSRSPPPEQQVFRGQVQQTLPGQPQQQGQGIDPLLLQLLLGGQVDPRLQGQR